jgi:coniferyl-aldehyde dehydrogenase
MQDEIFGPLLPIKPYDNIAQVIAFINARPRPLALYYFGNDAAEEALVLNRTCSGGVTLNDVLQHAGLESLPFGGVGASGMGAYHGIDGFRTFSHAKAVFRAAVKPA